MSANTQSPERLAVGVEDATNMIGIRKTKFYQLVNEGRIRTFKVGRKTLVPTEDLRRFVEEGLAI